MKLWLALGALATVVLACGDFAGPGGQRVALSIVPVFDANGFLVLSNADRLRIRIQRDSSGVFLTVKDTTVAIDADGNAAADIDVLLLQSPQVFRVLLDAVRSGDGAVLFSGSQDISVTSGTGGTPQEVQIPVSYAGPLSARVAIAPRDTNMASGSSFTMRATVFDASDNVIAVPVTFYLVNAADATKLTVNRLTGQVTAAAGQQGEVGVYAMSADSLRDTTRIFVGVVAASLRVTPGYGNVAAGGTLQLAGSLLDAGGNPVGGGTITWVSRTASVATVSTTGLVTAVTVGQTVVVATAGAFADSVIITVPAAGNVLVFTSSKGRSFAAAAVGDTVSLDLTADLGFASGEKLGSYGATLTWDAAKLQLDTLVAGSFPEPTVNYNARGTGQLQFAAANTAGATGQTILAKVRFRALSAGSGVPVLTFSEMSAPSPSFTNLFAANRVTVTNAGVTVR